MQQLYVILLLCLILFLSPSEGRAQTNTLPTSTHGHVWNAAHLQYSLLDKLTVKTKVSSFNTPPTISPRFIDLGLKYKLTKQWSLGAYYRFRKTFLTDQNRMYIETQYKDIPLSTASDWTLCPRIRFQKRRVEGDMAKQFERYTGRLRLTLSKPIKDSNFNYFIATEGFYNFENQFESACFARLRLTTGTKYKLDDKGNAVKVFIRYEHKKMEEEFVDLFSFSAIFSIKIKNGKS